MLKWPNFIKLMDSLVHSFRAIISENIGIPLKIPTPRNPSLILEFCHLEKSSYNDCSERRISRHEVYFAVAWAHRFHQLQCSSTCGTLFFQECATSLSRNFLGNNKTCGVLVVGCITLQFLCFIFLFLRRWGWWWWWWWYVTTLLCWVARHGPTSDTLSIDGICHPQHLTVTSCRLRMKQGAKSWKWIIIAALLQLQRGRTGPRGQTLTGALFHVEIDLEVFICFHKWGIPKWKVHGKSCYKWVIW